MEYREFADSMIPEAGALLALRHAANRRALPLLPARFEDPQEAAKAVETTWKKKGTTGFAAFRDGRMRAYLLGELTIQPWARCGYVYLPGYAVAGDQDPGVLQDLYARLGETWVRRGAFEHYLFISTADQGVMSALFDIGFGKEGVRGLLGLGDLSIPDLETPTNISVRRAGPGDNESLAGMSDMIYRAMSEPPYWRPVFPETWGELREGWSELADDKEWLVWIAFEVDAALGMIGFHPEAEEDAQMLVSPKTIDLTVAATKAQARGRGIATYLTWEGLRQARNQGFRVCEIGWASANLWAARHWPRYGFKDAAYRLAKRLSPDIAWTRK